MRDEDSNMESVGSGTETSEDTYRDMSFSAQLGKLRYANVNHPGISRKRVGKKFKYTNAKGELLDDPIQLSRIKSLAIPPAWTNVWICVWPNGHIQATGQDARQRKQYRYHKQWQEVRGQMKYEHMLDFGLHLPKIRQKVLEDMNAPGLGRTKILAVIISILENTLIRIGSNEYARTNNSFGLTTLLNKHIAIHGSKLQFHFQGKSGVEHTIDLQDRRLARIISRVKDIPGQELFQYISDDGNRHSINSCDVNEYLRKITGRDYTAKDFRTWFGTLHAALALYSMGKFKTNKQGKENLVKAIEFAASKLGNTPAICKKSYVHPRIAEWYLSGDMFDIPEHSKQKDVIELEKWMEQNILKLLQLPKVDTL